MHLLLALICSSHPVALISELWDCVFFCGICKKSEGHSKSYSVSLTMSLSRVSSSDGID